MNPLKKIFGRKKTETRPTPQIAPELTDAFARETIAELEQLFDTIQKIPHTIKPHDGTINTKYIIHSEKLPSNVSVYIGSSGAYFVNIVGAEYESVDVKQGTPLWNKIYAVIKPEIERTELKKASDLYKRMLLIKELNEMVKMR